MPRLGRRHPRDSAAAGGETANAVDALVSDFEIK
jgi:hypothetical protein